MPKTKRDLLRRQIAHAYRNVELATWHISQVWEQFDQANKDEVMYLDMIIYDLDIASKLIKEFAIKCWGHWPEDIETWRNVPYTAKKGE
jgi:hypothetical protein